MMSPSLHVSSFKSKPSKDKDATNAETRTKADLKIQLTVTSKNLTDPTGPASAPAVAATNRHEDEEGEEEAATAVPGQGCPLKII